MMDQQIASRLGAGLFLLHAPRVCDFRRRDDMLFAYLSDSDSDSVTATTPSRPSERVPIQPLARSVTAVTGTASGTARVPDQDVCVPSRPRRTIPYW
jgi:hypothetical protein